MMKNDYDDMREWDLEDEIEEQEEVVEEEEDESYWEESNDKDPLPSSNDLYFKEVGSCPLLSDEEVKELSRRIQKKDENGETIDKEALNELVSANLRLVLKCTKKYMNCGLELDELIHFGNMGLINAAEKYDYETGYKFSTYAEKAISNAIKDALPMDSTQYMELKAIKEAREEFKRIYHRTPTIEELEEITPYSKTVIKNRLSMELEQQSTVSLHKKIGNDDGHALTIQDRVEDKAVAVEDTAISNLGISQLDAVLNRLDENEQNRKIKAVWAYLKAQEAGLDCDFIEEDENQMEHLHLLAQVLEEYRDVPKTKVEENVLKKLRAEKYKLGEIPSGETEIMDALPERLAWIFENMDDEEEDDEFLAESDVVEALGKIRSTPSYKCMVRYLMEHYHLIISEENEEGIWKVLEEGFDLSVSGLKKHLAGPAIDSVIQKLRVPDCETVEFTKDECEALLALLYKYLKEDYERAGVKEDFTKCLNFFFYHLEDGELKGEVTRTAYLDRLALVTRMSLDTYHNFRKKLLKRRAHDYLSESYIFMFLTLKYAKTCDMLNLYEAYKILETLYQDVLLSKEEVEAAKSDKEGSVEASMIINEQYLQKLEIFDKLKAKYKNQIFSAQIPELCDMIRHIQRLKAKQILRSDEKVFLKEWEDLKWNMEVKDDSSVQRNLYVEKNKEKKKFIQLQEGGSHFLDSEEFKATYIDDNAIQAFHKKGDRTKRNLILTLIFLNLTYELQPGDDFEDRITMFEARVLTKLSACGFRILHSGSAYDTFLKMLLVCPEPMEMFKYIWRKKLGIEEMI